MIRVLIFLALMLALALGASWMADHPGLGRDHLWWPGICFFHARRPIGRCSPPVLVLILVWSVISFLFRAPSMMSGAAATRKRERGFVLCRAA